MIRAILICVVLAVALGARCEPGPVVPPDPVEDAGPVADAGTDAASDTCDVACAHFLVIECIEGQLWNCADACRALVRDRLIDPRVPECWILAADKPRARSCGSLECP